MLELLECPAGSDRNYLVSWFILPILGTYPTYLYRGEIIHLLSNMDITVWSWFSRRVCIVTSFGMPGIFYLYQVIQAVTF